MFAKFLTTKILGWSTIALGLALLASLTFGVVQSSRLTTANTAIAAKSETIKLAAERINSDRQLIAGRDTLIAKQNAAVAKLVSASQADRTAYLSRIASADKVALTYEASATAILARQTAATDELQRSRAALALIRETLAAERTPNVRP
jgi:antitoxin (DNA-binding transcriptional repressor) of toxin-antitoxin stability system